MAVRLAPRQIKATVTRIEDMKYDKYGQPITEEKSYETMVGVIRLHPRLRKTTVRTDSSASRSWAEHIEQFTQLIMDIKDDVDFNYKITIDGFDLKVVGIRHRYRVSGELDHYEVECEVWV